MTDPHVHLSHDFGKDSHGKPKREGVMSNSTDGIVLDADPNTLIGQKPSSPRGPVVHVHLVPPLSLVEENGQLLLNFDTSGEELLDQRVTTLEENVVYESRKIETSGLATGGNDLSQDRTIDVPVATQQEAEDGTANDAAMTPLRVAQAIVAQLPEAAPPIATPVEYRATTGAQTVTIPAGATKCKVMLIGAGGYDAANGGGPGAALFKLLTGLTPGLTLSLNVGAGRSNDGYGGNTTLASGTQSISTLTAGGGGDHYDTFGVASGGDLNITQTVIGWNGWFGIYGKGADTGTSGQGLAILEWYP